MNTYIFTPNGVAVVDGMVSAERAAFWSANGQSVSFLDDHANQLAPGIGYRPAALYQQRRSQLADDQYTSTPYEGLQ